MKLYKCIEADPPWPESGGGKIKRGADRHYPLIKKKEDILRVMLRAQHAGPSGYQFSFAPNREGSHLWIWVTNNYLEWGLWLMSALDFRYINNFAWVKAKQAFSSVPDRWQLERPGLGQYSMGQHELLLFGVMGKSMKPDSKDRPRTAIMAPRPTGANGKMIHSAKPPEARKVIEAVSPGPRMSMFARDVPEGWDGWGNEIEGSLL